MNGVSPSSPAPARLHLDFLDGVRGLAALVVVVHHLYVARMGMSARGQWPSNLGNALLYGHLAVGVFIVLSGFCLALPVTSSRRLERGALAFYGRRARRILPPFFAALLGSIAVFWWLPRGGFPQPRSVALNFLLMQDVYPRINVFNPPLWSVALEWKIYFLFPVFLWVWRRWGNLALIGVGALAGAAGTLLWLTRYPMQMWGHSCPWFIGLFALGIVAAGVARGERESFSRWMPWLSLLGVLALGGLLWQFPVTGRGEFERFVPALPWIDAAMGVVAAASMVMLARVHRERSILRRALEWRPLVWLGSFAYSLYLTHEPLIRVLSFGLDLVSGGRLAPCWATVVLLMAGLPILVGVALVFFLVFERPFLSRGRDA